MGGGSSSRYVDGSDAFIVSIMMPVYYIHGANVTEGDVAAAAASWKLITDDTSEEFQRKKSTNPNFTYFSCISWFFSLFYSRLFDVHPLCKPLFGAGLQSQGKFLVKMISLTLSQLGDQEVFAKTMHELTIRHCERGIKSIEYGVVGDVLFWVIKTCIGPAGFTPEVESAWIKIYSKMLQVIVPEAVSYERQGLHASKTRRESFVTKSLKVEAGNITISSTSTVAEVTAA